MTSFEAYGIPMLLGVAVFVIGWASAWRRGRSDD